ncbi:MAG TPA: ABC transporter permease [Cyclobacteriaceae bacterium]
MNDNKNFPPRWAERLLTWYCRPELLEDLQGDLNEYFERNLKAKGIRKAKLIYITDVFKFFRLYTLRKPEFINLLIHWLMIGSYIKTSGRSIVRNKLFSAINIIGLSVSMSVGLLVIAFTYDLNSYDDFHENKDRIYRVISRYQQSDDRIINLASTSVKAGKNIQGSLSGFEQLAIIRNGFGGDAIIGETILPVSGLWASESFFKIFTFPLISGDESTALKNPYSIVLTEKSAKKLFGGSDVLGKEIKFDTTTYVVTGVMKDIPKLSHVNFELLVSFSTAEITETKADPNFHKWGNIWQNYVYILFDKNTDPSSWQVNLDKINKEEAKGLNNISINLSLQHLKKIALGPDISNNIGPVMMPVVVWVLAGLALVIIISACFNYTNLSIARSMRRSKEVGIRKIIGARKSHVLGQFISESVIISLLALLFSFGLFLFLRSQFLGLNPFIEKLVSLDLSLPLVIQFIAMALLVGILAGLLPALFFSKINAIQVLKNASTLKVFRHVTMRKALIVVQYALSLMFITTAIIGYNQYKGFLIYDLGFTTENIINIRLQQNKSDQLIKELSEIPEVTAISKSSMITSVGNRHGTDMKYKNPDDSAVVWLNLVDEHYLPLHEHKLIAGKNFTLRPRKGKESEVIVNEQVLKRFDIAKQDPQKALGEVLIVDKMKLTIVGVLKDFHYGTLSDKIEPVIFRYSTEESSRYLNVKIASTHLTSTMASIEKAWKEIDKTHPIDAVFYEDRIEEAYSQFSVMAKVIGFIAFLAVCIASMGLFGMVVFTTETRLKEISIRKVLGANEGSLIYLLSKGFLLLLTLSALIALPITYLFFDQVVLTNFAYHQPIGLMELFIGALGIGMLAFIMIGSQTLKAARSNPAEVLKSE